MTVWFYSGMLSQTVSRFLPLSHREAETQSLHSKLEMRHKVRPGSQHIYWVRTHIAKARAGIRFLRSPVSCLDVWPTLWQYSRRTPDWKASIDGNQRLQKHGLCFNTFLPLLRRCVNTGQEKWLWLWIVGESVAGLCRVDTISGKLENIQQSGRSYRARGEVVAQVLGDYFSLWTPPCWVHLRVFSPKIVFIDKAIKWLAQHKV